MGDWNCVSAFLVNGVENPFGSLPPCGRRSLCDVSIKTIRTYGLRHLILRKTQPILFYFWVISPKLFIIIISISLSTAGDRPSPQARWSDLRKAAIRTWMREPRIEASASEETYVKQRTAIDWWWWWQWRPFFYRNIQSKQFLMNLESHILFAPKVFTNSIYIILLPTLKT